MQSSLSSRMSAFIRHLPLWTGIAAGLVTAVALCAELWFPRNGGDITDGLLGAAELSGWVLVHQDNGSYLDCVLSGLPFGIAFNVTVGLCIGIVARWVFRRHIPDERTGGQAANRTV